MAIVHILAHFDDEYCAWPLIRALARAGEDQWFFYLADYADPETTSRRKAETCRLLARFGVGPERVIHLVTGVRDGELHRDAPRVYAALKAAVAQVPMISGLVCTAWEGGHPDHDLCAAAAVRLSRARPGAPPIRQFALYHGRGLPGPVFRACDPIAENGPTTATPLSPADWLAYAGDVVRFPSQWRSWLGLWPVMFLGFLTKGFGYQGLDPARVLQRPHAGPLFYERRFGVDYATVRAAADALLAGD